MNTQNYVAQGSVLIGRVPIGGGNVYFPRYFGNGRKTPELRKIHGEEVVAVFTRVVDTLVHGAHIGRLCEEASETLNHSPIISEQRLQSELSKLLFKPKCS